MFRSLSQSFAGKTQNDPKILQKLTGDNISTIFEKIAANKLSNKNEFAKQMNTLFTKLREKNVLALHLFTDTSSELRDELRRVDTIVKINGFTDIKGYLVYTNDQRQYVYTDNMVYLTYGLFSASASSSTDETQKVIDFINNVVIPVVTEVGLKYEWRDSVIHKLKIYL